MGIVPVCPVAAPSYLSYNHHHQRGVGLYGPHDDNPQTSTDPAGGICRPTHPSHVLCNIDPSVLNLLYVLLGGGNWESTSYFVFAVVEVVAMLLIIWQAVCGYPGPSYAEGEAKGIKFGDEITDELLDQLDATGWQLFHVAEDPAEAHDLADQHPEKLREMISRWYAEAGKYKILPLDSSVWQRLQAERPQLTAERTQYVYYPNRYLGNMFMIAPILLIHFNQLANFSLS